MNIKKNKNNIFIILFTICSAFFAVPSIIYIFQNKTIYKFSWVWTYLFKRPMTKMDCYINAFLFFILFTAIFLLYFFVLKKHNKILKSKKQIFTLIIVASLLFMIIIPYTSTDVYSYIANGWSSAHYKENPYYISTGEIAQKNGVSDPMFNKVANCWRFEKVVYGPAWTIICTVLSWISFGNIDIALFVFKLANLAVHIINCILIYKTTKKNLFVVLYGLNPFILFEGLTNVHNDIFIVLFILIALYAVIKKKNLFIAVACIAVATAIKYLAILILPFVILYAVKDKEIKERVKCCIWCGIEYIAIIALLYVIYVKNDLSVLMGLFIQQSKYNRSIFYLIYELTGQNVKVVSLMQNFALLAFAVYYVYVVIRILISKKINMHQIMEKYNFILLIFTFVLITNFNPWYIMWLYPTIFLIRGKSIKNILYLSYTCEIANLLSFALWSEKQILGIPYFIIMIGGAIILNMANRVKIKKIA